MKTEKCLEMGHNFHIAPFTYKRDKDGKAFCGEGFRQAAAFVRVYCSRCCEVREIEIAPPLEVRKPPAKQKSNLEGNSKSRSPKGPNGGVPIYSQLGKVSA